MKIRMLLFAVYREIAGTGEVEVELPDGATAADAVGALRRAGNGCARIPHSPAVAVNQEYAALDTVLRPGDEVALLPPVAGG